MAELSCIPAETVTRERRPAVGYAMALGAATLFAVNGTVSKVILSSGINEMRLTELRCAGALAGLTAIVLATRPRALRTTRGELLFLAVFGILGVALVQLFYFLTIRRLEIGAALLIQYTAPLMVALWARFFGGEQVRRRIWVALVLALGGLSLVVDLWRGVSLDGVGVIFGLIAAVTLALYLLLGEHAIGGAGSGGSAGARDTISVLCYGFLFASVFWAIAQPWWSFPFEAPGETVSLLGNLSRFDLPVWTLMLWMVVLGTIVPFILIVGAMRHVPATRVALLAMLEPVVATIVAFAWLDETLGAIQLVGGAIVLAGIGLAQTSR